jgi:hypothetical protein
MFLDELFLRMGNDLYVFDRRETRLFRIEKGVRSEVIDRDAVALIVTSPAKVLANDQARSGELLLAGPAGA